MEDINLKNSVRYLNTLKVKIHPPIITGTPLESENYLEISLDISLFQNMQF